MSTPGDTSKAIRNLMDWTARPEWTDAQAAVFNAHMDPACERLGIGRAELANEIQRNGYGGTLYGVLFEDFVSRRLPNGRNVIDEYLKRRGWRESGPSRRYLTALRDSVFSLYEVVDVEPGRYCDVRDLLRGGDTVRVHERSATQTIVRWDRLAARVLLMDGRRVFAGGVLPIPQEAAQRLLDALGTADDESLREACPRFTTEWLVCAIERLRAPLPQMVNRDGEDVVFVGTRFPLVADGEETAALLDSVPEWERDDPDRPCWSWYPEPAKAAKRMQTGVQADALHAGRPIGGALEMRDGMLVFSANSVERAERGRAVLERLLAGRIGPGLSSMQTPERMLAKKKGGAKDNEPRPAEPAIDPDAAAAIIREMLDRHYRQCLDQPIPMLAGRSPRECAKSEEGRTKVIEWLKYLENSEQRRARSQGQEPYDSRWIWEELGLGSYRR